MKFGDRLAEQSVPEWSLHNVDYNSLKREIKAHTTRAQAARITIQGNQDAALLRFENRLYAELYSQHDRVGLFVASTATEISRRQEHVSECVRRLIVRCADESGQLSIRRQSKLAKYERELVRCANDLVSLERFVSAQTVAFRKILKKYKKWTGSLNLSDTFRENVLRDPKSFTRRDFDPIRTRNLDVLAVIHAVAPPDTTDSDSACPSLDVNDDELGARRSLSHHHRRDGNHQLHQQSQSSAPLPRRHYWNEYDDGSEAGDAVSEYAILFYPDDREWTVPGLTYLRTLVVRPFYTGRAWFAAATAAAAVAVSASHSHWPAKEREPLITLPGSPFGYGTAAPSIARRRAVAYRASILLWSSVAAFAAAFALIAAAALLLATGRSRMRAEVDAGAAAGLVGSLACAGAGLGLALASTSSSSLTTTTTTFTITTTLANEGNAAWRRGEQGGCSVWKIAVWLTFVTACALNGMVLCAVLGNAGVWVWETPTL